MIGWERCAAMVGSVSEDSRAFAKVIDGQAHVVIDGLYGLIDFCFNKGVTLAPDTQETRALMEKESIACSDDYMVIVPVIINGKTVAVSIDDMQFVSSNGESCDCIDWIDEDANMESDEYVELYTLF